MSSSDHEDGVTASQCIAVKGTILQLLNNPLTSEDALHLIDCFDFSLLKSTCATIRRLAATVSMFLLCLLADTPSKARHLHRVVCGPFLSRGRIVHLSTNPLISFSKEKMYLDVLSQLELPAGDKTLFFFEAAPVRRQQSFNRFSLGCIAVRQLLRSLDSSTLVQSLPDPQETPMFVYLEEREADILSDVSFSYNIRPKYQPVCCSEFCQSTAINSVLCHRLTSKPKAKRGCGVATSSPWTKDHQPHELTDSERKLCSSKREQTASLSFEKTYKSESTEESSSNRIRLASGRRANASRSLWNGSVQPDVDTMLTSIDRDIGRVLNNFMKSALHPSHNLDNTSMRSRRSKLTPFACPAVGASDHLLHTFNSTSLIGDQADDSSKHSNFADRLLSHVESSTTKTIRILKSTKPQPRLQMTMTSLDYKQPLLTNSSNDKRLDVHTRDNRRSISTNEHANNRDQLIDPNWKLNSKVFTRLPSSSLDHNRKANFRVNNFTPHKPLSKCTNSHAGKPMKKVTFQDQSPTFNHSERAVDSGSGETLTSHEQTGAATDPKKPFFFRKLNK